MSNFKLPKKLRSKVGQEMSLAFESSESLSEFNNKLSQYSDEEMSEYVNDLKNVVGSIPDEDFLQMSFMSMLFFPEDKWYNMINEVYEGEFGTTEGVTKKIIDVSVSSMLSSGMKNHRDTLLKVLRTDPSLLIGGIVHEMKSMIDNEEYELIHHGYEFIEKTRQEMINAQ